MSNRKISVASPQWDRECDFLVLGAGGGGLVGALAAREAGLDVILSEKENWVGGATVLSGGTLWLLANSALEKAGVNDSLSEGRAYLSALIKPEPDAIDQTRIEAFIEDSDALANFLNRAGLELRHARGWSDYYAELPGGLECGRTLFAKPFDVNQLGTAAEWLPAAAMFSSANSPEVSKLALGTRSFASILIAIRVFFRSAMARIRGAKLRTRGQALIGRLLLAARAAGIEIWRKAPMEELILSDGRVVGALIRQDGRTIRVHARRGVLLTTGGFAHNPEMRLRYQAPVSTDNTMAPKGDTGDGIIAAEKAGASVAMMEESWWVPGTKTPSGPMVHVWDRCFPHSIIVDVNGQRYMDESGPYMETGQSMIRHHAKLGVDHSWIILEKRHRRRYAFGMAPPMVTPRGWLESGYLTQANSIGELADAINVPRDALTASIAHFNNQIADGNDHDFGRGSRAISRFYGDPSVKPNPNLGQVAQPPFYAIRIYPGDVGTAGGIRTDADGRALDDALQPIPGLYAAGNAACGIFGPWYPGAGASIAPSMLFARRAALAAAQETGL